MFDKTLTIKALTKISYFNKCNQWLTDIVKLTGTLKFAFPIRSVSDRNFLSNLSEESKHQTNFSLCAMSILIMQLLKL